MDRPVVRDLIPIERVWTRLEAVEEGLRRATTSSDPFLTRIAQHLLAAGGKRYRPLLAQVAAELGPPATARWPPGWRRSWCTWAACTTTT